MEPIQTFYEWVGSFRKYHYVGTLTDETGEILTYRYWSKKKQRWISVSWYRWEWKIHMEYRFFEDPRQSPWAHLWEKLHGAEVL